MFDREKEPQSGDRDKECYKGKERKEGKEDEDYSSRKE